MPNDSEKTEKIERVSVQIPRAAHVTLSSIAKLLGKDVRGAVSEAVDEWNERNRAIARKKANELLAA